MPRLFRFCPSCGSALSSRVLDGHRRRLCPSCGFIHYLNPTPAVGVLILRAGRLLLVRRKYPPYPGLWSMPAGFMEYGESPEQCAVRETKEETGLRMRVGRLVGVYSGRDDPRTHAILIVYRGTVLSGRPRAGDDASEIGWFTVGRLPRLAFRAHRRAIRDLMKTRGK
jgi:ADP-ribose pyrophosphatase YjhB (NUDIX family)